MKELPKETKEGLMDETCEHLLNHPATANNQIGQQIMAVKDFPKTEKRDELIGVLVEKFDPVKMKIDDVALLV